MFGYPLIVSPSNHSHWLDNSIKCALQPCYSEAAAEEFPCQWKVMAESNETIRFP